MKKIGLILLLFGFAGCFENALDLADKIERTNKISWSPHIAIPLVYSDLSLDDIVKITGDLKYLRRESDKSLTLVYAETLFSLKAEDVIQIPDQSFNTSFTIDAFTASQLQANDSVTIPITQFFDLSYGINEIDSIWYKEGSIDISLTNGVPADLRASLTFPNAEKNGSSISSTFNANYAGLPQSPTNVMRSINLNGAKVDFTTGSQGHSQLRVSFNMVLKKNGGTVVAGQQIQVGLDVNNQKFAFIRGYMNDFDISNGAEGVEVQLFDNTEPGSFHLVAPSARFLFTNSFGVPIEAELIKFEGVNTFGNTVNLTGAPSPIPIPYPGPSEVGKVTKDSFVLDNNNSNLSTYISNQPYKNNFEYTIITNPQGPSIRNWFLDTSLVECQVIIEIPLWGSATDYKLETEAPLDLELDDVDILDEVTFRLYTENGYPADIRLQAYFEDSVNNIIYDSLLGNDQLIFPSAGVDGSGRVNKVNPKTTDIVFSQDRLKDIKQANRIRYRAYLNSFEENGSQPDVKFYDDYTLLIQFGIQAKIKLEEKR